MTARARLDWILGDGYFTWRPPAAPSIPLSSSSSCDECARCAKSVRMRSLGRASLISRYLLIGKARECLGRKECCSSLFSRLRSRKYRRRRRRHSSRCLNLPLFRGKRCRASLERILFRISCTLRRPLPDREANKHDLCPSGKTYLKEVIDLAFCDGIRTFGTRQAFKTADEFV